MFRRNPCLLARSVKAAEPANAGWLRHDSTIVGWDGVIDPNLRLEAFQQRLQVLQYRRVANGRSCESPHTTME